MFWRQRAWWQPEQVVLGGVLSSPGLPCSTCALAGPPDGLAGQREEITSLNISGGTSLRSSWAVRPLIAVGPLEGGYTQWKSILLDVNR